MKPRVKLKITSLTLYHTIPTFNDPVKRAFKKTLWKKEKMLVTSIFSFSLNVLTIPTFNDPVKEAFKKNIVEKGENAGNQHFLLFPQCFLPIPERISVYYLHLLLSSANA